jgi:hypothetical protein
MRLSVALVFVTAATIGPGCTLLLLGDLGFEQGIERGSVSGRLVRADTDGEPAPFAQVALPGSGRSARSDSEGRFLLRGLQPGGWALRLADDVDGDGWAERAALRPFRVELAPHANTPVDVVAGGGDPEITGLQLGDIELAPTGVIDGTVTLQGGVFPTTAVGRVAVLRDSEGGDEPFASALGAEALTHVDDDGRFYLAGLRPGPAKLVALAYGVTDTGELGDLLAMSEPRVVDIAGNTALTDPINVGTIDIDSDLAVPVDDTLPVALNVTGNVGNDFYVMFATPGSEFPPCAAAPQTLSGGFAGIEQTDLFPLGGALPNVPVPMGIVDIQVCSNERGGILRNQIAEEGTPVWGPVALGVEEGLCETSVRVPDSTCVENTDCEEGACRPTGEVEGVLGTQVFACFRTIVGDCDGDRLPGLPDLGADTEDAWNACGQPGIENGVRIMSRCGGLRGDALGGATCTVRMGDFAGDYDCDDDGDGQADVDEPLCYGEGLGTDLDGDGLCSGVDPYPLCADNNPVDCDADRNDAAAPAEEDGDETDAGDDGGPDPPSDGGGEPEPMPRFVLDSSWANGGVLTLTSLAPMGQSIFARIADVDGVQAFVFATSADGEGLGMVWSVDVFTGQQTQSEWGGTSPIPGKVYDLLVDPGFDPNPPKVAVAFTTDDDTTGDNPDALPSWAWLETSVLESDLSIPPLGLTDRTFDGPHYIDVPAGPDGGTAPELNPAIGGAVATGVSQTIDGKLWITGGTVDTSNGAGSVFLWGRNYSTFASSLDVANLLDTGSLPVTRWPMRVDLDFDNFPDLLFVPASTPGATAFLAGFDLTTGEAASATYVATPATSGDAVLDGYTDGAVRAVGNGHELIMVGRNNDRSAFIEFIPVDLNNPALLGQGERHPLPEPPSEALAEPRVAVIDDDHVAVTVLGGGSSGPGTFTLGTSRLMIVDNNGIAQDVVAPTELGEPSALHVDVHPSPDGEGFLVARWDPALLERSLIKVRVTFDTDTGNTDTDDMMTDAGTDVAPPQPDDDGGTGTGGTGMPDLDGGPGGTTDDGGAG